MKKMLTVLTKTANRLKKMNVLIRTLKFKVEVQYSLRWIEGFNFIYKSLLIKVERFPRLMG